MRKRYIVEYYTVLDITRRFSKVLADDRDDAKETCLRSIAREYNTGTANIKDSVMIDNIYVEVGE